jgi:pyrroloquinoline quinone biosynthesis protein E
VFCYNPTDFARTGPELATADWLRVLGEARELGAVQLGLSGGEPLARDDLEVIVAEAHRLGFYINLITSGIGLSEARIRALRLAGLDHIQLSFQDSTREMNDFLSSTRTFELKSKVAALIREHGYPMVLNVVLHRHNIDHVGEILDMAERMGAQPTRSTTAGPGSTASSCCRAASSCSAPKRSPTASASVRARA